MVRLGSEPLRVGRRGGARDGGFDNERRVIGEDGRNFRDREVVKGGGAVGDSKINNGRGRRGGVGRGGGTMDGVENRVRG